MAEYIEREAVIDLLTNRDVVINPNDEVANIREDVECLPAADVRPVVRGRWERMSDNDVFGDINCKCSACGEDWWQGPGWFRHANYCPNCGAEMRGERD